MAVVIANNATATLAADIAADVTALVLDDAAGWPDIPTGDHAWLTIDDGSNVEVVRATARIATALTIERGQDGTTATAFSAGAAVEARVCRALLQDVAGIVVPPVHTDRMYAAARAEADGNTFTVADFNAGTFVDGTTIVLPTFAGNSFLGFAIPETRGEPSAIQQPNQPLSALPIERQPGSIDIGGSHHLVMRTNVVVFDTLSGLTYEAVT